MKNLFIHMVQYFVSFVFIAIISGLTVFAYFTLSDIQALSKVTLSGYVSSPIGSPIAGANITLQEKSVTSDNTGKYKISNLKWGWNTLTVNATNFSPFQQDIYLPFGEQTEQIVVLSNIQYAVVKGSVVPDDPIAFEKNKDNLIIKINDTQIPINIDNTFESSQIGIQKVSILIQIPNFEDYYSTWDLSSGVNDLRSIMLKKTITSMNLLLKDKITDQPISNTSIVVNDMVLKTDTNGRVNISNSRILVGDTLKIKVNGYQSTSIVFNSNENDNIVYLSK